MSQTSYPTSMQPAFEGQLADNGHTDKLSYLQGEVSAEVPFGVCVAQGAAGAVQGTPDKAILPAASNAILVGVVIKADVYHKDQELGTNGLKPKATLSVLRKGRIWVKSETANTIGQRAHVRYAAGAGGTQLGAFRNATVASETIDATNQVVFRTACSAGGLCIAECDFTNEP